jgi:hypothetical protein
VASDVGHMVSDAGHVAGDAGHVVRCGVQGAGCRCVVRARGAGNVVRSIMGVKYRVVRGTCSAIWKG